MPQYGLAARLINEERLSCRHVHTFNMDEYANEDGETAPTSWPGSFQRAMMEHFFGAIDPDLRPREEQDPLSHARANRRLLGDDRGARRRGRLLRGDRLVWAHRLLGVAPRSGVRGRPRGVQAGGGPPRGAPSDDDHAERTPLVRGRLVAGFRRRRTRSALARYSAPGIGASGSTATSAGASRGSGSSHGWSAHGPVSEFVPGSILQTARTDYTILGGVANDVEIHMS